MKRFSYVMLCFLFICRRGHFYKHDLYNYLKIKHDNFDGGTQLKNMLESKDNQISINFFNKTEAKLVNFPDPRTFELFNETYYVFGSHIYLWGSFNKGENEKSYSLSNNNDSINLIKTSAEFRNKAFVLASFKSDVTDVYVLTKNDTDFVRIQSLSKEGDLLDARFFIRRDSLYLITCNPKHTIIYKWLGEHFDEIYEISEKCTELADFTYMDNHVLGFFDNSTTNEGTITLYHFDKIPQKIQFLKIANSYHFEIYRVKQHTYMIIFSKNINFVYNWNNINSEFVYHTEFKSTETVKKTLLTLQEGVHILFLISTNSIQAYKFGDITIQFISGCNFNKFEILYSVVEDRNQFRILGKESNEMDISLLEIGYESHTTEIMNNIRNEDPTEKCMSDLHDELNDKIGQYQSKTKKNYSAFTSKIRKMPARDEVDLESDFDPYTLAVGSLNSTMNILYENILRTASKTTAFSNIEKSVLLKGNLVSGNAVADNIEIKVINKAKWTPDKWLSYTKSQTISNQVIDTLLSKHAEVLNFPSAENLILNNNNISISKAIKITDLTCDSLTTTSINDIKFNDIYLRSNKNPIQGLKKFRNIKVENIQSSNFTFTSCNSTTINKFNMSPDLEVQNLEVDNINNINWAEFTQSLFKKNITKVINGTLSIPHAIINKLITNKINGVKVEDILTTSTNQTLKKKISFNKVNVGNINVETINGIDFDKETVLINSFKTIIEGPVKIHHLNATKIISNNNQWKENHYRNVKILGNLYVKAVNLSEHSKIFIKNQPFHFNVSNQYWLVNTDQTIPNNVKIANFTTKNIDVITMNGFDGKDFVLAAKKPKVSGNYYFKHLTVNGNIKLNPEEEHKPNWENLNENVVTNNRNIEIIGKKVFTGIVNVEKANIDYLNNVDINTIPTVKSDDLTGLTFNNIIVKGNLTLKNTKVNQINNKEINKFYDDVKFVDKEQRFKKLTFENLFVEEIIIEEHLNDKNVNEYIENVNKIHSLKKIENVTTFEPLQIKSLSNVKLINGIPIAIIQERVRKGAILYGNATFKNDVYIENLYINHLNGVNVIYLLNRLLFKNWQQSISGKYTFEILKTNQLVASRINDYNIETLIDIKLNEPQTIKGDLIFQSVEFLNGVYGQLSCDLKTILKSLKTPLNKTWKTVTITGNITTFNKNNALQDLIENIVRADQINIINAPVKFSTTIHTENLQSKRNINDIDIGAIFNDALRRNGNQIVTGHKTFSALKCGSAQVNGDADIPVVNAIRIRNLNDSLIRKDLINSITIKGHKIFTSGLKANHIQTNTLSGLKPENLVNLDDLKPIPKMTIENVNVFGNATIKMIDNQTNFQEFLENRFLKSSNQEQELKGVYYFHKMEMNKPFNVTKINNINFDEIVFNGKNTTITGVKEFVNNIKVYGNVTIDILNDFNLNYKFNRSILLNKNNTFKGDLFIQDHIQIDGDIQTKHINGVPIKKIKELLHSEDHLKGTKKIDEIVNQIENTTESHRLNSGDLHQEYMYLEESQSMQINIPNTVSAEVIESKHHVLLHIVGEEPGKTCGLPKGCNCQHQHLLQLSRDYSLWDMQTISSKQHERVFSFHSERMVAHLVTQTISSSRICTRYNSANYPEERTTLTWMVIDKVNNNSKSFVKYNLVDGFITGAKFFEYLDDVYIIITRFYSPLSQKHNLECIIFKLGRNQDTVEIVQKIPTKGAWTLHLFNSYQGLILVIGNIFDSTQIISGTSTDIYRFNTQTLQFDLLKQFIGAGAISIADVVLNKETQIILAQKDSPLIVLKYNPSDDNYQLFQSIYLEFEVLSVSKFYLGGSIKDAYLNVVTDNNQFFLYRYKHIEGWKLESRGEIEGLRALVPFSINGNTYLLAPSTKISSLLIVQKHG